MATFSFDIVSDYDKAEMNNVFLQVARDITNRYDFKGTPAEVDWLEDKSGFKLTAANDMQLETLVDMVRRHLINRGQSTKTLDLSKDPVTSNLKMTKHIPFIAGLDSDKAKVVTKVIRESHPKVKPQIQGDEIRVSSPKKDELQAVMTTLNGHDFDFPLIFRNFR